MFTETQSSLPTAEAPRKFLFDRSFDASAIRAPERKPVTLKPDQYDALKQESYNAGFAAGKQAGLDEQNAKLMALLAQVESKLDAMAGRLQELHRQGAEGMRCMALAIARKFVPALVANNGAHEMETLIASVMAEMVHEPRLVVRVHEAQFDIMDEKISAIAAQKAYAGKVVVLADAGIAAGDCLIEWADGGVERNTEAMWKNVEQVVSP